MEKLTIEIPVYNCKCVVTVGDNIEKRINSFIKRKKIPLLPIPEGEELYGLAFGLRTMDFYYIFYSSDNLTMNTVAHEICHTVDEICEHRDIEDKEARAYLSGHITEKVFDFLLKKKLYTNKYMLV